MIRYNFNLISYFVTTIFFFFIDVKASTQGHKPAENLHCIHN